MRTGVLGGTFNPIHRGHLALARAARDRLKLDRVILIPSNEPPHKKPEKGELAPAADRLAMVERAVAGETGLEASDIEVRRGGPSYTVDTVDALHERSPDDELFFLIGADSLAELPTWHEAGRLLESVRFVVVNRPGHDIEKGLEDLARALTAAHVRAVGERVLVMPSEPVSSTAIRERVRRSEPIDGLVPDAVRDYMTERGLYRG